MPNFSFIIQTKQTMETIRASSSSESMEPNNMATSQENSRYAPPPPSCRTSGKVAVPNQPHKVAKIPSVQILSRQKFHVINQSLGYNKIYIYQNTSFYA